MLCFWKRGHEMRQKSPVSQALADLRKAMGKTQQEFAVHVLDCAISTLARYETSDPPRGDVLLRLAEIADKAGQQGQAEAFRAAYREEQYQKFGDSLTVSNGVGYLSMKLTGATELAEATEFMKRIGEMQGRREPGYDHPLEEQFGMVMQSRIGKKGKSK
jgi:transcriptional regulator with XRE-family HTH domain